MHLDITEFPTIWAVLSILLDTQEGTLEYVHYFQYAYNRYYETKTTEYMQKLEMRIMPIQESMYDSIKQNYDSVSGTHDDGPTPLLRQQDEQPQAVNAVDKTITHETHDII